MKLTVNISKRDINVGLPKSCSQCPNSLAVFRAANRANMDLVNVETVHDRTYVVCKNNHFVATNPDRVQSFIEGFDVGEPVEPIRYQLDLRGPFPRWWRK